MDIENILEKAISQRMCAGAVLGVVHNGKRQFWSAGSFRYEAPVPKIQTNAIFDVASITKTVPTSLLALIALDRGEWELNTLIKELIPELSGQHMEKITLWHLLTQTLHFHVPLSSMKHLPSENLKKAIFSFDLPKEPGTTYCYCNATSVLLGLALEKLYGVSLPELAQRELFTPMGMVDTAFKPVDISRVVPTEVDTWRGREICGEVHDESAWKLQELFYPGSAGLFSTVPDLLKPLEMILNKGEYEGRRFLSESLVNSISSNQIEHLGLFTGLGWELNQRRYTGQFASEKTLGKTGFTGTVLMADMEKEVGLVLLSNFTYPRRKYDVTRINRFRSEIADAVFSRF